MSVENKSVSDPHPLGTAFHPRMAKRHPVEIKHDVNDMPTVSELSETLEFSQRHGCTIAPCTACPQLIPCLILDAGKHVFLVVTYKILTTEVSKVCVDEAQQIS